MSVQEASAAVALATVHLEAWSHHDYIEPGSAQVIAGIRDQRNSLILISVRGVFAPGGETVALPGAGLALFDEQGKLKERVVFMLLPG